MSEVESFRLGQLSSFGILVNPQWTVATLEPEDVYVITSDCVSKLLTPPSKEKQHNTAALVSWISENNQNDNPNTLIKQILKELSTLPKKLPSAAKERFDACSTLGQILKTVVGLPDSLDYSAIMYPNEKHSRELISTLLERLTDHTDRVRSEVSAAAAKEAASSSSSGGDFGQGYDSVAAAFANYGKRNNTAGRKAFAGPSARRFLRVSNKSSLVSIKKPEQVVATALYANALRRLEASLPPPLLTSSSVEDPEWFARHEKENSSQKQKKKKKSKKDGEGEDDLVFASLADVAPEQAAKADREAAELQARLKNQEASVAAMKNSVEDAQRKREEEDADLSAKLKELRSGIKVFKNRVKSAKSEMETLEEQFLSLESSEADEMAALDAELAKIAARREIIDGVATGGQEFVDSLEGKLDELRTEHADLLKELENKIAKQRKKQNAIRDKIKSMGPTKKERLAQAQAVNKNLIKECRLKLEEHDQLEAELERNRAKSKIKLDRGVLSRMIYNVTVRRHAKQQEQIESIVHEIGIQERKIAELSGAISQRYGTIESDMYAAAKTDFAIRDLFPPLVGLRSEYVGLVKKIADRGKAKKETHDVESRLNKLMRFGDSSMLSSAQRDLQLVNESIESVQKEIEATSSVAL